MSRSVRPPSSQRNYVITLFHRGSRSHQFVDLQFPYHIREGRLFRLDELRNEYLQRHIRDHELPASQSHEITHLRNHCPSLFPFLIRPPRPDSYLTDRTSTGTRIVQRLEEPAPETFPVWSLFPVLDAIKVRSQKARECQDAADLAFGVGLVGAVRVTEPVCAAGLTDFYPGLPDAQFIVCVGMVRKEIPGRRR